MSHHPHLLRAELLNLKLLHGLQEAGMVPADFYGDLHVVVFQQLGWQWEEMDQEVLAEYWYRVHQYLGLPQPEFFRRLPLLVEELYAFLLHKRNEQKTF